MNKFKILFWLGLASVAPSSSFAEVVKVQGSGVDEIPADFFNCKSEATLTGLDKVITKVQDAYVQVKGLTAKFRQKSSLLGMPEGFFSGGELKFLRPGKMSWKYLTPKPQSFISNGDVVWFYEPEVNQVTIIKLTKSFDSQIPVSFLLGVGELKQSFDPESVCNIDNYTMLNLKPKGNQGSLKFFSLLVDSHSYLPAGAKMTDVADTSTEFVFDHVKVENSLDPKIFIFSPPPGVDIIKQ